MDFECNHPLRKSVNINVEEVKKSKKIRTLEKEFERKNREPSQRLSKKSKKMSARLTIVLQENKPDEETEPSQELCIQHHIYHSQSRVPLKRINRKPSHRPRAEAMQF